MCVYRFQNEIKLFETKYELAALVKHMFTHFSVAVCDNDRIKWVLLDDFQDYYVEHDSLAD